MQSLPHQNFRQLCGVNGTFYWSSPFPSVVVSHLSKPLQQVILVVDKFILLKETSPLCVDITTFSCRVI